MQAFTLAFINLVIPGDFFFGRNISETLRSKFGSPNDTMPNSPLRDSKTIRSDQHLPLYPFYPFALFLNFLPSCCMLLFLECFDGKGIKRVFEGLYRKENNLLFSSLSLILPKVAGFRFSFALIEREAGRERDILFLLHL